MSDGATATAAREYGLFLGGRWEDAVGGRRFEDRNPFDGSLVASVAAAGRPEAAAAVAAAAEAFPAWSESPPETRQRLFLAAAARLDERHQEVVELLAVETGATRVFAAGQLAWVGGALRLAAGLVYRSRGELIPSDTEGSMHLAVRRPLGVVAGITPWNGAQIVGWRTVIAPLAYGNTVVLKPSELAPITAGLLIAEIAEEVGFPAGVLNVVTHAPGEAGPIADELFENEAVRCLNFTGSTRTGRALAERAAGQLKRSVLELGGHNPLLVLRDADLEYAVDAAVFAAFLHQGQVCLNARKAIVEEPLADAFLERLQGRAEALRVGDPRGDVDLGPLIGADAVAAVRRAIDDAVGRGARLLCGGESDGNCVRPAVLTDVPPEAEIYREEVFGPVLVVERAADAEAALRIANDHRYGLAAGIITADQDTGLELAARIRAGVVHVNDQTMHDEPQMPVGGVGDSGWGRSGPSAIEDFTYLQWLSTQSGRRRFPL
jgi:acyl-CoA reductase-like NAD-dependent aldehyde dehydrogenase